MLVECFRAILVFSVLLNPPPQSECLCLHANDLGVLIHLSLVLNFAPKPMPTAPSLTDVGLKVFRATTIRVQRKPRSKSGHYKKTELVLYKKII